MVLVFDLINNHVKICVIVWMRLCIVLVDDDVVVLPKLVATLVVGVVVAEPASDQNTLPNDR